MPIEQDEISKVIFTNIGNLQITFQGSRNPCNARIFIRYLDQEGHFTVPSIERKRPSNALHANGNAFLILSEEEYLPSFVDPNIEKYELSGEMVVPELPEWITLYISAGKKDKVNKIDIVGLLLQKGGLAKEELGKIDVLDKVSYAAVKREKAKITINLLRNQPLKKKKVKIEISN